MLVANRTSQQLSIRQATILLCLLLSSRNALAALITSSPSDPCSKRQVEAVGSDTYRFISLSIGGCMRSDFAFDAHDADRFAARAISCNSGRPCLTTTLGETAWIYCSHPLYSYATVAYDWNGWPQTTCPPRAKCWLVDLSHTFVFDHLNNQVNQAHQKHSSIDTITVKPFKWIVIIIASHQRLLRRTQSTDARPQVRPTDICRRRSLLVTMVGKPRIR